MRTAKLWQGQVSHPQPSPHWLAPQALLAGLPPQADAGWRLGLALDSGRAEARPLKFAIFLLSVPVSSEI